MAAVLRLALGASAAVLLGACFALLDTRGLAGGEAPDATTTDEASAEGAPAENGADSTDGIDAPSTDSTVADSADDGPPTGPADCSGTIADSFDTGALGAQWSALNQVGLTLSLDSIDSVSPPNSLLVAWPANTGGKAFLGKSASAKKSACCLVAFRSDANSAIGWRLSGMGTNYGVSISASNVRESYYAGASSPGINRVVGPLPNTGKWQRVRVDASLPQGKGVGTVRVTVDGAEALVSSIGSDLYDLSFSEIDLGVTYAQADSSAHAVRFDDVSCLLY
jgi:hypothetical protein